MAKAKQLPSGNWRVLAHATVDGKGVNQSFTAPTKSEAERKAEEWQKHCKMVGNDSTSMTVKEAMLSYIEIYGKDLSPSTVREYTRIANSETDMPDLKNRRLCNLTCPIIKMSMNKCSLSPKTIKNRYGFLQRILTVFYPEFVWAVDYPKIKRKKKPAYSVEFIRAVLGAVKDSRIEVEVYLGLLSMRASEIAGLMWSDIDFENKRLEISRVKVINSDGLYVIKAHGKTDLSARTIYLPDKVIELLFDKKEKSTDEFVSDVNPNQLWLKFNRRLKSCGLPPTAFHELRHIYSSLSASMGIDTTIRMANGGWSNEYIMDGTYRHPMSEKQIEANQKINNFFN